jgi:hypothetical protein
MAVTYRKLKSGEWGVAGPPGEITPGAVVTVQKASGDTKQETVGRILFSNAEVAIASVVRENRRNGDPNTGPVVGQVRAAPRRRVRCGECDAWKPAGTGAACPKCGDRDL